MERKRPDLKTQWVDHARDCSRRGKAARDSAVRLRSFAERRKEEWGGRKP